MSVSAEIVDRLNMQEPGPAVLAALTTLLANDAYLLEVDANERSISHLLAIYLHEALPNFHVDCEYNRDGVDPKRIRYLNLTPSDEDTDGQTVFPDIIVHRRNTEENYLVIEIKKTTSTVDCDIDYAKLSGYKRELGYKFALFIELRTRGQSGVAVVDWL